MYVQLEQEYVNVDLAVNAAEREFPMLVPCRGNRPGP